MTRLSLEIIEYLEQIIAQKTYTVESDEYVYLLEDFLYINYEILLLKCVNIYRICVISDIEDNLQFVKMLILYIKYAGVVS